MDAAMSKEHSESDLWGRAAVDLAAVGRLLKSVDPTSGRTIVTGIVSRDGF